MNQWLGGAIVSTIKLRPADGAHFETVHLQYAYIQEAFNS